MRRLVTILVCMLTFNSGAASAAQAQEEDAPVERSIPLNPDDPTFDVWREYRDMSDDAREPGPINIQRFNGGSARSGIPTFFNLPVALTPADLKAGEVDVAILGAPFDFGSGFRGAGYGPRTLRTSEPYLFWGQFTDPHMHVMVNWQNELTVVDYGDAPIDYLSAERSLEPVRKMVREVASTGAIPFIVGGDHSLEYPNVAGIADVYGKSKVGVVHFDAHYDAGEFAGGHLISHGIPIRRLINEGHVEGKNYIQVGLRGYWPGKSGFEWMREHEFRYHTMVEIDRDGWDVVMKRVLEEAREGTEFLYISLDIDVLDPAYTPGTGTPEPGGLTPRELFPLLRGLCAENDVVGFDIVEFNPLVDPGYITGLNANRLVQECLTGLAMHKLGLAADYLSPLTVEDARP